MTDLEKQLAEALRSLCKYAEGSDVPLWLQEWKTARQALAAHDAAQQAADPTDPGYDVEVLREHVRHLERRVRQLSSAQQAGEQALPPLREYSMDEAPADYPGEMAAGWACGAEKGYADAVAALTQPAQEAGNEVPWQLERQRHIANEWADMATNGMQWLRNIKDGISTVEDALASMATNYEHCRKVNDAPGLYGSSAIPQPAPEAQQAEQRSQFCPICEARGKAEQPAQAVPLTDEQIAVSAAPWAWLNLNCQPHKNDFARAIERACAEQWGVKLAGGVEG